MENEAGAVGLAIILALILASAITWILFIRRVSNGFPSRRMTRPKVPWGLLDLALVMVLVIAVSLVNAQLLVLAGIDSGKSLTELTAGDRAVFILVSSLAMFIGVLFSLVLIWLKNRPGWDDLGIGIRGWGRDVWIGVVAFLLISAPVYAIQFLLVEILDLRSEHPLIELVKQNPDAGFFLVTFLAAVVLAPLSEEFFFRVLLQGRLERIPGHRGDTSLLLLGGADVTAQGGAPRLRRPPDAHHDKHSAEATQPSADPTAVVTDRSDATPPASPAKVAEQSESPAPFWPILVSSLIFAAVHISHGVDPIPLFVLALGLGYVYRQTHRVLPCIVTHMLFNAFSLVLLLVEVYGGTR